MLSTEDFPDTPVMRQYRELKGRHPQALMFFRLGDFYELFGDDARDASQILGLVLTQRQGVPMCGVPFHNAQNYLARLLRAGRKIAIAEQLEAPSKDKKLVARGVIRVVTPGTVVEDELLDPKTSNFLVAVEHDLAGWGAACLDVSTGESWATQTLNDRQSRKLFDLLARINPAEVVATREAASALWLRQVLPAKTCLTIQETAKNGELPAWADGLIWKNHHLALKAALSARRYVDEARFRLRELPEPAYQEAEAVMQLDETAIRTLELVESASGEKRHTLWGLLDGCLTPMGSRKIKNRLLHPSTDLREIERRQNCVEDLLDKPDARRSLGRLLQQIADLPRVTSRLSTRQAGPRDLGALRRSLIRLPDLERWIAEVSFSSGLADLAEDLRETAKTIEPLREYLQKALTDDPPAKLSDGGLIRPGFHAELDELRRLKNDSDQVLRELEEREKKATGISSLKAGYNSVFGYYLEITKAQSSKAPATYIRKQTLTNAERYITPELKELETRILSAEDQMLRLEAHLFDEVREKALAHDAPLLRLAEILSELDVFQALAAVAAMQDFVKPKVDLSHDLEIVEGRHPVLAALLPQGAFVPNSLVLNARDPQILILTGPNMSGKSTYLRQNALIALMAQAGSFVPARSARVGVVDKILTRIGAQDALAQGDSTFMVEMKETSHILRSATARSLVVLDEVGRGTSTFDGISIAWAVLEHLHGAYGDGGGADSKPRGPRTLFATHYFELTGLAKTLPGVVNVNVEVKEWRNAEGRVEVVFLHKIGEGPADRSYGIHVAALAGLPAALIARANEILSGLENESASGRLAGRAARDSSPRDLPLFETNPILQTLMLLNPETMTPIEALSALNALKKMF
ncbi:MAG: DNA mismatch repair protein MutS [Elusimicrobia bacterium GWA2_66_18]|nr:MAG: DNA mismatch repair protein MutS [Elusimicrobia bacterium GWA2_66_18]